MSIAFENNVALMVGDITIEDVENLNEWLVSNPLQPIDLLDTTRIHTAMLQVLMAHRPRVAQRPRDMELSKLLQFLW